ncbi:MAG: hypothetical protein CVV41_19945, partial [Candidatus Riflebacteria bacterium HGW-Riflebacteria-1]
AKGKSFEEIAEATDLPIDQIKVLAGKNKLCEPTHASKPAKVSEPAAPDKTTKKPKSSHKAAKPRRQMPP